MERNTSEEKKWYSNPLVIGLGIVVIYLLFFKGSGSISSFFGLASAADLAAANHEPAAPSLDQNTVDVDLGVGITLPEEGLTNIELAEAALEVYKIRVQAFTGLITPFATAAAMSYESCQSAATSYVERQPLIGTPGSEVVRCIDRNFWGRCKKTATHYSAFGINPLASSNAELVFNDCVNDKVDTFNDLMLDFPVLNASFIQRQDGTVLTDTELRTAFVDAPAAQAEIAGLEDIASMIEATVPSGVSSRNVALFKDSAAYFEGRPLEAVVELGDGTLKTMTVYPPGEALHGADGVFIDGLYHSENSVIRSHPYVLLSAFIQDEFKFMSTEIRGARVMSVVNEETPEAYFSFSSGDYQLMVAPQLPTNDYVMTPATAVTVKVVGIRMVVNPVLDLLPIRGAVFITDVAPTYPMDLVNRVSVSRSALDSDPLLITEDTIIASS